MSKLQIYTFGTLQVVREAHIVTEGDWHTRQARQLLKILITERPRPVSTDRLIEILWPNSTLHAAATTLRSAINALRNALEPNRRNRAPSAYIITETPGYAFQEHPDIWLDVANFEQTINQAEATLDLQRRQQLWEQAIALYKDDYLTSDPYADWVLHERERLRERYFTALLQLAEIQASQGNYTTAIAACRRILARDEVRENAYQLLMRYQAETGDSAGALVTYERCRTILAEELGADPSPLTQALHQRILNGEVAPRLLSAQSTVVEPVPTALPAALPLNQPSAAPLILPQQTVLPLLDAHFADQLVGREVELQQLRQALHAVLNGPGRLLLLEGEAGVGKTRLAYHLLQEAIQAEATVISGTCQPLERQLPFAPLADCIGRYLYSLPDATLHRLPMASLAQLAQIVPSLQDRLPDLPGAPHENSGHSDENRQRLIDGIVVFLITLARARPLLLLLDDLHWADPDTLAVLSRLSQRLIDAPLLLLLAYRSDDLAENEALTTLLHSFTRVGLQKRLNLQRLTQSQVRQLVALITGRQNHSNAELAASLYDATGGNALFVTEALRDLHERAQAANGENPLKPLAAVWVSEYQQVPALGRNPRVQSVILERISRLTEAARSVLQTSAVIGRDFSAELLEQAAPYDPGAGLEILLRRKFLLERPDERFDFSHQVVRQVAYESLNALQRRRLHQRVADALVALGREQKNPSEIAFHYEQAGANSRQQFAHYSLLAGEKLLRTYGFRQAVACFDQTLAVLENQPSAQADLIRRALQGRGLAYESLYDPDGVTDTYRRLQQWARQQGNQPLLLLAHGRLTAMLELLGQQHESNELLSELIEELATGDNQPPTGLVVQDLFERRLCIYSPDQPSGAVWADYVPPPAPVPNPVQDILQTMDQVHAVLPLLDYGWTLLVQGQLAAATDCLEAVVELAKTTAQPLIASTAYHQLAALARLQGDLPRSHALNEQSLALNRQVQGIAAELASLWPRIGSALRSLDANRLDEAERRLRWVTEFLGERDTFRNHRHSANIGLGLVALARGNHERARHLLEGALADATNLYPYTHVRALLGLARLAQQENNPQQSNALLQQALRFAGQRSLLEEYIEVILEIYRLQPPEAPHEALLRNILQYTQAAGIPSSGTRLQNELAQHPRP